MTLFKVFLILHIFAGSIGLITGTLNIVLKKGGKRHVQIGKLFVYSMLVSSFSALLLSFLHSNPFLFIIGIFTIYLVGTGNRYIYLKMLEKNQKPAIIDWILTIGMLLTGIMFIAIGVMYLISVNAFGIVFLVFGSIGLLFVRADLNNYKGKVRAKNYWLLSHLQRMTVGYIASLTAFLVVNYQFFPKGTPPVLVWLLPGIVLTPLIVKWVRKYKKV